MAEAGGGSATVSHGEGLAQEITEEIFAGSPTSQLPSALERARHPINYYCQSGCLHGHDAALVCET